LQKITADLTLFFVTVL